MLSIVCTGESNNTLNKWLDYYFRIGIRYIFYMGLRCPNKKMIHIPSKKKTIKEDDIFKYMKKNHRHRAVKCYIHLKIGDYLKITPVPSHRDNRYYDYFHWCKENTSINIKAYDNKPRLCRSILDKRTPVGCIPNISVQLKMPVIDRSRLCLKDLSDYKLDSSLFSVEMIDDEIDIFDANEIFKKNGFVIVKNAIPTDVMEQVANRANSIIHEYRKEIVQYYKDGTSFDVNDKATEISCRPGSRIMIKTSTTKPFTDSELIANEELIELIKLNLDGERIEIGTMAAISALPKTDYQHWHRDVPIIFPNLQKKMQLPAQGLIMVAGVEDVPLEKGPTNFIPSSNVLDTPMNSISIGNWIMDDVSCEVNGYCAPELKRGDVLMFDLRTLHRGGNNSSDDWRTIMYITYVNEWYIDRINFNTKQTKEFDEIEEESQLLLSRIDHETYIQKLEDNCNDNGIEISESNYEHGGRHELVN